ncbi:MULTISPECIES: helix-turn-helix transcriptional regulator [unclassified Xanthomonas]|uniref:AraC family transcriptional regulator n=1 Tax=unclassified Xanthomonas TaxID=2643310 RepID=UPI00163AE092|nr:MULTISPECIES: helix-turn-helix transcriptional regulator [unclassified Xanthomonas]QNH13089.1 AraC family transcriptional regulator [Xanthomonas sp. SI]QNH16800.1 AraC family transcriptional regulator [Xanthomonas sp. SS]
MKDGVNVTDAIAVIAHDGPRYTSGKHRHAQAQLLYAISGVISVTTERGTWVVPPSRAVWLPPHMEHTTATHSGIRFRSLLIGGKDIAGLPDECMVVEVTPLLRELILKLAELAGKHASNDMAVAVIRLLLMELSFLPAQALNLPAPRHPGLTRLCEGVRGDPSGEMSIVEAAATLNMSRATFIRAFQRETGMSFGRWRQQARMLHALTLLADGRGILGIALECGYDSPSAFSAAFRRSLGRSPSDYFSVDPER